MIQKLEFGNAGALNLGQAFAGGEAAPVGTQVRCSRARKQGCQQSQNQFLSHDGYNGRAFAEMTLEEKIGQLFIIPACELREEGHFHDIKKMILQYGVGGVIFKQGTVQGQRELAARLQQMAKIPLLCVQDGEWGVAMRLSDAIAFPRNLTLGAVQDLSLLFRVGQEIGRQCRLVGVHLNLAPVCDVNCNPDNPIIHMRSFGESPYQVAMRSKFLMCGIQSTGVLACAKHFPGHGDTTIDSHQDLPVITHGWQRLQSVELFPFRDLIQGGVKAVMTAHLDLGGVSTFSYPVITGLLQEELGFRGLIITDAMNMKAISRRYSSGEAAIRALLAGHDLLLYGDHIAPDIDRILRESVPEAYDAILTAVKNDQISEAIIDSKVEKILNAKAKMEKLFEESGENVLEQINSSEAFALKRKLFQEAITLVRNESLLPLTEKNIALIEWGKSEAFAGALKCDRFMLEEIDLLAKVKDYRVLVIALSQEPSEKMRMKLIQLSQCGIPTAAVLFMTPYALSRLPFFESMVVAYENETEAQEAAAAVLLGKSSPRGRLPVSALPHFTVGTGMDFYSSSSEDRSSTE